ncbi:MAG: EAL domain-containing protein [Aeromicrobium sp.]|nr:EAL domain-containing protein [Burkholderiales bacterium]
MNTINIASSDFVSQDLPHHITPPCAGCDDEAALDFKFSYAYQPIVDVVSRTVFAQEALVRGPEGESAHTVLSRLNDTNRYRFDQACRVKAIKGAAQLGMQERLSINFLPNAIYKPEVCIRTTLEAARAHSFPVQRIIFEATEGEVISDGKRLAHILSEYKRTGFLTAIDDFGAGYAGLNLLADFQPDIIKLDIDLVRGVDISRPRQAIARGIIAICNELGVTVLVEGIETTGERDFFVHAGVSLMQGYLFGRPAFQALGQIDPQAWPRTASLTATPPSSVADQVKEVGPAVSIKEITR